MACHVAVKSTSLMVKPETIYYFIRILVTNCKVSGETLLKVKYGYVII